MPRYPEGFSEEEYEELRGIVRRVGERGSFDANDIGAAYLQHRAGRGDTRLVNAGSVSQILEDLDDLGVLRPLGGDPPRWELVEGSAST